MENLNKQNVETTPQQPHDDAVMFNIAFTLGQINQLLTSIETKVDQLGKIIPDEDQPPSAENN